MDAKNSVGIYRADGEYGGNGRKKRKYSPDLEQ